MRTTFRCTIDAVAWISRSNRAIELGLDFFDTADVYGAGHNEELVGRARAWIVNAVLLAVVFSFAVDRLR